MGAPLEICRKRSVVAVLASGVVISLTAMTGGIAPAFAAPKTDPVAPTTTVVAPEPKAPQETPTVAEEPPAPPSVETPPKPQISEAPAIAAAPPETQAPPKTQAPEPQTPAAAQDAGTRTGDAGTAVTTGDADACAQAAHDSGADDSGSDDSGRHPGHQRRTPQAARCSPVTRRAGADDVDRAEPDEFDAYHHVRRLDARRLDPAIGRTGGSRPGTEPGTGIERCLVDTDQRFGSAGNAGRPDRGVVQCLRGREGDPDRAASDVAGARAGRRARQERESR